MGIEFLATKVEKTISGVLIKQNGVPEELVEIGSDGALADAEAMIQSIKPSGYTEPWNGLDAAFADQETTTVFLLSDGVPMFKRSYWSSSQWPNERRDIYEDLYAHWDQTPDKDKNCEFYNKNCSWNSVASFYINKNSERPSYRQLKVHTVSIDLESDWMEKLSQETGGSHNQVKSEN